MKFILKENNVLAYFNCLEWDIMLDNFYHKHTPKYLIRDTGIFIPVIVLQMR